MDDFFITIKTTKEKIPDEDRKIWNIFNTDPKSPSYLLSYDNDGADACIIYFSPYDVVRMQNKIKNNPLTNSDYHNITINYCHYRNSIPPIIFFRETHFHDQIFSGTSQKMGYSYKLIDCIFDGTTILENTSIEITDGDESFIVTGKNNKLTINYGPFQKRSINKTSFDFNDKHYRFATKYKK